MATVWATHLGDWAGEPRQTGWSHHFPFNELSELNDKMGRAQLLGQVSKLAIVAHGDQKGKVQLAPRDLTAGTASLFAKEFRQLKDFLIAYGRLVFLSCIAGADEEGTSLLNTLSLRYFPDRHIIGFEKLGYVGRVTNMIGVVDAVSALPIDPHQTADEVLAGPASLGERNNPRLTEYSWFAKWSLNGRIIKLPMDEQGKPEHISQITYGIQAAERVIRQYRRGVHKVFLQKDRAMTPSIQSIYKTLNEVNVDTFELVPSSVIARIAKTPHH